MSSIPAILLGLVLIGSWVFCILAILAARSYRKVKPPRAATGEPISILKPLHGLDDGLEQNLRTFFVQDYPNFEILFAAREDSDAGLALARRLSADYPNVPTRFFVTGEPPYPNAKVWSLEIMTREARHDLLVMSDSDIRTAPGLLQTISDEFASGFVGVATCPYRAVPGRSFWSTLEAIGMGTEFWAGAFTARYVERGVRFTIGPTVAARRTVIDSIGGWPRLSQYLAEDFVMGQFAAEAGHGVILSSFVVEHRIGAQPWRANFRHRLRWNRSTRRSRPAGYVGQLFTNPIPIALLLVAASPQLWPALVPTALLRAWTAYAVAGPILHSRLCGSRWYLVPLQDLMSFIFWLAGFFGNTIEWRGRRYLLLKDGRFERAA